MELAITLRMSSRVIQYTSVAAAVTYCYDYTLTLEDEWRLFWKIGGSWIVRTIFIAVRYTPLAGLPLGLLSLNPFIELNSNLTCRGVLLGNILCRLLVSIASTAMFCLRVHTLCRQKKGPQRLLMAGFGAYLAFQFVLSSIALSLLLPRIGPVNRACIINRAPPSYTSFVVASSYLCAIPCETIVIVLTVRHAVLSRQSLPSEGDSAALPILKRLYKDGIVYFGVAFLLRISGCFVWFLCPSSLAPFADSCSLALRSIVASRFFLSLRKSIADSVRIAPYTTTIAVDGLGGTIELPPAESEDLGEAMQLSTISSKKKDIPPMSKYQF